LKLQDVPLTKLHYYAGNGFIPKRSNMSLAGNVFVLFSFELEDNESKYE